MQLPIKHKQAGDNIPSKNAKNFSLKWDFFYFCDLFAWMNTLFYSVSIQLTKPKPLYRQSE